MDYIKQKNKVFRSFLWKEIYRYTFDTHEL